MVYISSENKSFFILAGAGILAATAYFIFKNNSVKELPKQQTESQIRIIPFSNSSIPTHAPAHTEARQFNSNTSLTPTSFDQSKFAQEQKVKDIQRVYAEKPTPKTIVGGKVETQQSTKTTENEVIDFAGHFGLVAASTFSMSETLFKNALDNKALLTGVKNIELVGIPAGIAADVIFEKKSLPLAVTANLAGDIAGGITGVAGSAVATPIGGAIISAGTQIAVSEGIYKFADNFNLK